MGATARAAGNLNQWAAAAMSAGPDAASSWAALMADNDLVSALKACRADTGHNAAGRRHGMMPVWPDLPPAPHPTKR